MTIKTDTIVYEVGWKGTLSDCAIDKSFVEAEYPAEAAEVYYNHCTSYSTVTSFYVRKIGKFRRTYLVAKMPDKTGGHVYRTIKSGWYPLVWI